MTLIRHLVWHDLRSQRVVLLAWAAFLLASTWLTISVEKPDGRYVSDSMAWARVILVALVTSLVIQQDALVGTSAFWRTRPIARRTLLASKAATLGVVLIGLPGLITWLVWAWFGLYAGDAGIVALALMLENAAIVLLTAMAAVVTPSLTYLIVAGVAGGTMVSLINAVVLPALQTTWPFVGMTLRGQSAAIYLGTLFALGVPAVAHQYLRLKEWHTAWMVGMALLASTTLARVWPVTPPPALPPVDVQRLDPKYVSLLAAPDSLRRTDVLARTGMVGQQAMEPQGDYSAIVIAQGQPGDVQVWIDSIESRLLLRDRTETWSTRLSGGIAPAEGWRLAAHRHMSAAVAPARLPAPPAPSREMQARSLPLMQLPVSIERAYQGQQALLTTEVNLYATRLRIAATARPAEHETLRLPGGAVQVLEAGSDGRRIALRLRTSRVESRGESYRMGRLPPFQRLVLRNLRTNEAWPSQCSGPRRGLPTGLGMGVVGVYSSTVVTTCMFGPAASEGLDGAWLADAELLAIEDDMLGAFTRPIQMNLVVGKSAAPVAKQ